MHTGKTIKVLVLSALALGVLAVNNSHAGQTYQNPVYEESFKISFGGKVMTIGIGDPTVIVHNGKYYMYATGDNKRFNAYVSEDLVNWEKGQQVFETSENGLWAPDVFYNEQDRKFYLYYTAGSRIGVAVSDVPDSCLTRVPSVITTAISSLDTCSTISRVLSPRYPWNLKSPV